MNKNDKWMCPVCGSAGYTEYNIIDTESDKLCNYSFIGYECNGCSVRFGDPDKFNFESLAGDELVDMTNDFVDEHFTEEI